MNNDRGLAWKIGPTDIIPLVNIAFTLVFTNIEATAEFVGNGKIDSMSGGDGLGKKFGKQAIVSGFSSVEKLVAAIHNIAAMAKVHLPLDLLAPLLRMSVWRLS